MMLRKCKANITKKNVCELCLRPDHKSAGNQGVMCLVPVLWVVMMMLLSTG